MKLGLSLILCAALMLTACGGEAKKETGGRAGGEILPASVSDAMLPRDTVRSQAPLAPVAEGSVAGKEKPAAKSEVAEKTSADSKPAPKPTSEAAEAAE